jgi:predicted nucleic acid-binding protein
MNGKAIVLDANILIRAALGKRVRELIFDNAATVKFFAPDIAYADAQKYLPVLLKKRGVDSSAAMVVLDRLERVVQSIDAELYEGMQQQACNASQFVMRMTGLYWRAR